MLNCWTQYLSGLMKSVIRITKMYSARLIGKLYSYTNTITSSAHLTTQTNSIFVRTTIRGLPSIMPSVILKWDFT